MQIQIKSSSLISHLSVIKKRSMNLFLLLGLAVLVGLYIWDLRYFALPRLIQWLGAREIENDPVWRKVQEKLAYLAHRQRVPQPKVWILPEFAPNALVLRSRGTPAQLLLTEGLLRALSSEELDAALALCLAHGYQARRRAATTWCLIFFPFSRLLQTYPLGLQLFLFPMISFLLRLVIWPRSMKAADQNVAEGQSSLVVAAVLQRLVVVNKKIPLQRWNLALDGLFLLSPLVLEESPFWVFPLQPSIPQRRAWLLEGTACETQPSLS